MVCSKYSVDAAEFAESAGIVAAAAAEGAAAAAKGYIAAQELEPAAADAGLSVCAVGIASLCLFIQLNWLGPPVAEGWGSLH